ncbi:branched-chain amino acid ABC transporter permease [Meiothermus taiwanensis]|jgi:branched-chain amino acid transport system permease protein|uniref:High-affinity branched-chain amino acid transport system permease protein LivH n=2 Tax=Meiothermus taiwanensis TaxID=172827 RepID=A0A399E9F6_9DEIN|nr:branched-chain amino acid ABC transporter permease [Meiothermus taiwanensis]AWR87524.1 inner-membrane translocator [Meiothermus taiwanensis WR-220]KIQ56019.1 ABC transporter permease [Meiothermus taiwanensis]RIH78682.1 High-affinity branched-chain amino acid transport system permease protein LivH [Meiothermus taiwanensis]
MLLLLLTQLLNSLAFAMLLFLLALGLSLIFGVARVVNLAHGAFYLLGAYLGLALGASLGSFWLVLLLVPLLVGLLGVLVERFLLRGLHGRELEQVLVTIGLGFILADLLRAFFGAAIRSVPPPAELAGPLFLGSFIYPKYPLFVLVMGVLLFLLVRLLLARTPFGVQVRAVTADPGMASTLGIQPARVSLLTFGIGTALAGLGGVVGAPMIALAPGLDAQMTLFALIVVVIGGLGRIEGAFWGAILVGLVDGFGRLFLPQLAMFLIFALMALVLALKPEGLLGRRLA